MGFPFFSSSGRGLTLLFVTPQRLVRADFIGDPAPTLTNLWQAPAPPGELLPMLAEAAFLLGPTNRTNAYVIASTVATQFLSVPTAKVGGLEGEELLRALSFEAEALSGLNPFESSLGAVPQGEAGGERQYWVTQIATSELQQMDESLSRHKGLLAGVLHAGGLPRNVESGSAGEPWQRVEVWNDAIFCVDTSASGSFKLHLIPSPPNRTNWQPEADSWFKGCGPSMHRETLVSDPSWLSAAGGGQSLDEEQVLRTFLTAWAKELSLTRSRVPVVRPAARPMPAASRWAIGGGLAAAALLVCGGHWLLSDRHIKSLELEIKEAQKPAQLMQSLMTVTADLDKQLTIVNEEITSMKSLLDDWKNGVTREHRRHATLLDSLLNNTPASLMIESITEKPGDLRVTGISMTAESPGFGNGIAASMEQYQWTLDPPHRRAMNLAEDGGPWQLQWVLRPYVKPGLSATNLPSGATAATLPVAR